MISFGQNYTSFFTGDTSDVTTNHQYGVCLMGGATENDNAMRWFLEKADGGDVVVLRASGSDGYNNYFYSQLGVNINSVETLLINNAAGALDPYVLQQVANAEALWFAGGDQFDYVSYFKDTAMEDVLNNYINVKHGVIGGTSAGMAILGGFYFDAQNGTVTSEEALANPYFSRVSLGYNDFLEIPFLQHVVTDTHYDERDRMGRHFTFMARYAKDTGERPFGIACEEYTAVCMDENGQARVYGEYPSSQDFAYFLQANCVEDFQPENCTSGNPLTWSLNTEAVKVYKVPGTFMGDNTFNVAEFSEGTGGVWEDWYANGGTLSTEASSNPGCILLESLFFSEITTEVFPNPFNNKLYIENVQLAEIKIFDMVGKQISKNFDIVDNSINTENLPEGVYLLQIVTQRKTEVFKIIKKF